MQMNTGWKRLALAAGGLFVAGLLVACGGDDGDGDAEGSAGDDATVVTSPTATPTPLDAATSTPGAGGAAGGTGSPPAPPSFPTSDEPPVTTASANGQSVETGIGTYCWTRLCVDKIGVPTKGMLTVSPGDVVTIVIPDEAPALKDAAANVFEAVDAQALDDGSEIWPYPGNPGEPVSYEVTNQAVEVTVDLAPGQYVLAVGMYFAGTGDIFAGDVVYGVLLEVQ